MAMASIYLDYNATAPLRPAVVEEMTRVLQNGGNPSSVHHQGRAALHILETSRRNIARAIGADSEQIIFTSGGTESNNLALRSVVGRPCLLVGATEHDSVLQVAANLDRDVVVLPVDEQGLISADILAYELDRLGGTNCLVSLMLANNETGVIQPIADLCHIAKEKGALFHTDAVQALGKIPVNFAELGVDMMSLSAHKMGGPQGVGALIVRENIPLRPIIQGGGQERRRRSGTENLAGIAGFAKAMDFIPDMLAQADDLRTWRGQFEDKITEHCSQAIIHSRDVARLPGTVCLSLPGVNSETQVMAMDLAGICISAGSACSSGKVKSSHVLRAMGIEDDIAGSSIRISMGWQSQPEDIQFLYDQWSRFYARKVEVS